VRQLGAEPVNGMPATAMLALARDGSSTKAWIDNKYGLVLKIVNSPKGGETATMIEAQSFTPGKPPAAIFRLPAHCAGAAAAPRPLLKDERIAAETGGNAADYTEAIMPPASSRGCDVAVRVVREGTMEPIGGGFEVTLDSGSGMRDVSREVQNGVLRIAGAPEHFQIDAGFGSKGHSFALIYRQCFRPETVLLLVVKNPEKLSDGAEWLWVKSGKLAALPR
jgi:hypothetical protein